MIILTLFWYHQLTDHFSIISNSYHFHFYICEPSIPTLLSSRLFIWLSLKCLEHFEFKLLLSAVQLRDALLVNQQISAKYEKNIH